MSFLGESEHHLPPSLPLSLSGKGFLSAFKFPGIKFAEPVNTVSADMKATPPPPFPCPSPSQAEKFPPPHKDNHFYG